MTNRHSMKTDGIYSCWAVFCLLAVLVSGIYCKTIRHDFLNYDDETYVTANQHVRNGLDARGIGWAFTASRASNWHPLTWISHMMDVHLWGMNPGGHHFTNIVFHLINSFLIFFLLYRMTGKYWQSGFVAVLFAVHPLHVESVAWVSERKDVLSTCFGMLTLWSYLRFIERPGLDRYFPIVIFYTLGLMAKPMLVTLPCVFLLLDYWPLKRFNGDSHNTVQEGGASFGRRFLSLAAEKLPLVLIAAGSSLITIWAQNKGGAVGTIVMFPFWDRAANASISYVAYIQKMMWPFGLSAIYPYPAGFSISEIVSSGIVLLLISLLGVLTARRFPYGIVGWLWYLGTLVPVIGLVQIGSQSMADRYTYIPLIGLFIIIAWGIGDLVVRLPHRKVFLSLGAMVFGVSLTITAYVQAGYWKNSTALFQHAVAVTSRNWTAYNNLGCALSAKGRVEPAIECFEAALAINPGYGDARFNLGLAYISAKRLQDAEKQLNILFQQRPDDKEVNIHLGMIYTLQNRWEKAIEQYTRASVLDPDDAGVLNNLGVVYAKKGDLEKALWFFQKAVALNPVFKDAVINLEKAKAALMKNTPDDL